MSGQGGHDKTAPPEEKGSLSTCVKKYLELGLSVIPLRFRTKEPLVSWGGYQKRPPTEKEVREWLRRFDIFNVGIVCGRVSGNLVVIDFDSMERAREFLAKVRNLEDRRLKHSITSTWWVKTGKGIHVYFRIDCEPEEFARLFRTRPRLVEGVDVKAEGGYVVAPPSIHPSGGQYRFIQGPPSEIVTISVGEWSEILKLLGGERAEKDQAGEPGQVRAVKRLAEDQINRVVELLRPYYVKGYRDFIVFSLLGALVKNGVDYESARTLIERLAITTGDEEARQRLYLVDYHYGGRAEAVGIERLKGVSGLREVLERQLVERGLEPEEARDRALETIHQLNEILGISVERSIILSVIKTGTTTKFYANDPKRGILILTRRGNGTEREYILGYYIDSVTIHVNPSDANDRVYSVVFRHPKTGDVLTYSEQTIADIAADIESTQYGARNPSKLRGAISSIIEAMVVKGLAEVKNKVPATGFFELDGKLTWFESPRFRVRLPRADRERVIDALRKLEELLEFYGFSDRALAGLYWGVQAPLGYVRKTYGRENRILFLYGEPHVGKTLLMKMIAFMWGLEEDQGIIGAAKLTAAQLAEKLNRTTLPVTLDEVRNAIMDPHIADMIKNSTTNLHIKSRILPHMGYRVVEFYAYASAAMTANYVPQLYVGLEERIIPVEWTAEDKRSEEEVKRFLRGLAEYKRDLAYIGSYLRDLYVRRWGEIKEIILSDLDQLEIGRKLLGLLYEDLGLERPSWLRSIELRYEIDQPTPEEIFFEVLREDLIDAVRKAGLVLEVNRGERVDLVREDWLERIAVLGGLGFLPSYMVLGRKNVYIKTSVIEHIRRRRGYEIAGGLRNLACRLGYRYGARPGVGKCMWIPLTDLVHRLAQIVEEDEKD